MRLLKKLRLRPEGDISKADVVVSVLVGFNFAVASPVLDYLGRNTDVFTSQDSTPGDVALVVAVLTLGIPVTIGILTAAFYIIWRRLGLALHGLLLVGLLTLFLAYVLDRTTPLSRWPAPALFAFAAALGVAPTFAYFRNEELRKLSRLGVLAPAVFVAVFTFLTPAGSLLMPAARAVEQSEITVGNPAPVVILMLDGLPVVSLMDHEERIDEQKFPGFARLAEDATWFRNTTTHHPKTRNALPGMLTGNYPEGEPPPVARNFPGNLFPLLEDHYRTVAFEPWTSLCPKAQCPPMERRPTKQERLAALGRDVSLLGLHAVLPRSIHDDLPPAELALGEVAGAPAATSGWGDEHLPEGVAWDQFLEDLRPGQRPGLHLFHSLKPHFPWHGLPGGQEAYPPPQEPNGHYIGYRWGDDWMRVAQWQRQLLQVGYVDRLLGELIDTMQDVGIYDDALVIVASDHGEAFTVGEPARVPTDGNLGEIAFATLFVKEPGQQEGKVVDEPAEVVDIFPTILDVLDVEPRGETDGVSLLGPLPEERQRSIGGWDYDGSLSADGEERNGPLQRKIELFGCGGGWDQLFRLGPFGDLTGRSVSEIGVAGESDASVRVHMRSRLRNVDVEGPRLPTVITGTVHARDDVDSVQHLAIALNDRVAAVIQPYQPEGSSASIIGVIPQDTLLPGSNTLKVYEIREGSRGPTLWLLGER